MISEEDKFQIRKELFFLGPDLLSEFFRQGVVKKLDAETEILAEGQYVKMIPVVLDGLIRVYSRFEDKELLLYYIQPFESCIMSFAAGMKNQPSKVFAVTEEPTRALLLPSGMVSEWIHQFPGLNDLFYQQYNMRYAELLETIRYLLYHKLDKRIYDYLVEKSHLKDEKILDMRHKQIANELGTAREVISRLLKKMEKEGKIRQGDDGIEIIGPGD